LLLLAGVVDGDQLIEAVQTGYERGKGSLQGYDPGLAELVVGDRGDHRD
jgi:hypothetical protein